MHGHAIATLAVLISCAEGKFTLVRTSVASCPFPLGVNCDQWPSSAHGTVYLYESQEDFAGTSLERFF